MNSVRLSLLFCFVFLPLVSLRFVKVLPIGQLFIWQLARPVSSDHCWWHAKPVGSGCPAWGQEWQPALWPGRVSAAGDLEHDAVAVCYDTNTYSRYYCDRAAVVSIHLCIFNFVKEINVYKQTVPAQVHIDGTQIKSVKGGGGLY